MPPVQAGPLGHAFVSGKGWVLLATPGQRFVARLIDAVIVFVVLFFVLMITGVGAISTVNSGGSTPTFPGLSLAVYITGGLTLVGFGILYEVALVATKGATLGKMAMRIKVVDEATLEVVGWGRALVRWVIPTIANFVCSILGLIVYLSFLWDSGRRQGWHDRAARDLVIQTG